MFRLKATIVAMTLMRPWRTGWSVDRGVDFSLAPTPVPAGPAADVDPVGAEPACFIDEDQVAMSGAAVAQAFVSDAAEATVEPPPEDVDEAPALRAWWSLAGKPPRT